MIDTKGESVQNRPRKLRRASRSTSQTASVTSAVGVEETIGRQRARRTSIYTRTVMWITGLVCAAFLLATFSQAWSNSNLMEQVQKEQQTVNQVRTQHTHLQKADQYYSDPGTLESEARQNLGEVRPGEQPVIIMNAGNQESSTPQPSRPTPTGQGHWQDWWHVFFGSSSHP